MARKRKRRVKKANIFSPVVSLFRGVVRASIRVFPAVVCIALVTGIFLGVRRVLYADSNMIVSRVEVVPPDALTNGRRSAVENSVLGRNILQIDLKAVSETLATSSQVRQVRVSRDFPSTIRIEVTNRQPVAFIRFAPDGTFGIISGDGVILDTTTASNDSMVTIEAYRLGARYPKIGARFNHQGFDEIVRFIGVFEKHPIAQREKLSRITMDDLGNITIVLGSGPPIRLGRKPAERLETLDKVMYLLEGKDRVEIEYIDLQYDNVIVKRKS